MFDIPTQLVNFSQVLCSYSQGNVLLGGFGTDGSGAAAGPGAKGRQDVSEVSAMGFVGMLFGAKKVVIVPGTWDLLGLLGCLRMS